MSEDSGLGERRGGYAEAGYLNVETWKGKEEDGSDYPWDAREARR